jgi:hypothetical protein
MTSWTEKIRVFIIAALVLVIMIFLIMTFTSKLWDPKGCCQDICKSNEWDFVHQYAIGESFRDVKYVCVCQTEDSPKPIIIKGKNCDWLESLFYKVDYNLNERDITSLGGRLYRG